MRSLRVGMLGLGEAGSIFATQLAAHGAEVHGFDPADVAQLPHVCQHDTRKLLRSVLVKGLSALVVESMRAAEAAGMADWFRAYATEVLCGIDQEFLARLVAGNLKHSQRRAHEMAAAAALLRQLGEPPVTAEATRQVLESIPQRGVPDMSAAPAGSPRR